MRKHPCLFITNVDWKMEGSNELLVSPAHHRAAT
jgi:hypothetical protein